MRVHDIMTHTVVSCPNNADIGAAARLMLDGHFGALPVVDSHGRLAGIITDRDIAMAAATRQRNASHISVHEAMSQKVRTCFAGEDVATVLETMENARVRRLPVVDADGHLVGILSIDDVVTRALDKPHGVSAANFVRALTRICATPSVEPDMRSDEMYVSG